MVGIHASAIFVFGGFRSRHGHRDFPGARHVRAAALARDQSGTYDPR